MLPDSLPDFDMTENWASLPSSPPPGRPGIGSITGGWGMDSESSEKVQKGTEEPLAENI